MLRKICTLSFVVALALFAAFPLSAQNGDPAIATTATAWSPSPAYIDAYIATGGTGGGTDICVRINTAWALLPSDTGTLDARAFTGSWTCSVSPFSPTSGTPHGLLLLGDVSIASSAVWIVPTQTEVRGIGHGGGYGSSSGYNTIISAGSSFPSSSPVIQMGPNGSGNGPWFGIKIDRLTVDCHGVSGCTGIFNNEAEENSIVDDVQIWDAPAYGLHVSAYDTGNTSSPGAVNSGPYRNVYVSFGGTNCTGSCAASAVGIEVDGLGSTNNGRAIRGLDSITTTSSKAGTPYMAAGVIICGVSSPLTNAHIEYTTIGIEIGAGGGCDTSNSGFDTQNVQVANITIATLTGGSGQIAIQLGAASNTPPTDNVEFFNITNGVTAAKTIIDEITGNTATDARLGWYFVGEGSTPSVYTSSTTLTNSGSVYNLKVVGNADFTGSISKGSGMFKIDHPLDPQHEYLYHSFVESPDMMNIYNGSVTTDKHGLATVTLPTYFEALNRDFRYQLTPIGQFAQAMVAEKIKGNRFVVKTNKPGVEVSWQVTGIRHDTYANQHPMQVEQPKPQSVLNH
jgi:hypothetical protein